MIKNIFLRRRPYMDHSEIACLRPVSKEAPIDDIAAQGYSFPSGHSTTAVTTFTSLGRYRGDKVLRIVGVVIPLLVGLSRVCLGVHYPTDVLVGWMIGLLVVFLIPALQKRFSDRPLFYMILLAFCAVGFFYCQSEDYYTSYGLLMGFVLSIPFEKRFVKFENTRSALRSVLRMAGGVLIYFGLNIVLKKVFSLEVFTGPMAALYARALRYTIISFVVLGVYPTVFKPMNRFFQK